MKQSIFGAAVATLLLLLPPAGLARADVVDQTDRKRLPAITTPWGDVPSDQELNDTRRQELTIAYDTCEFGRQRIDSALVKEFWISETIRNQDFNAGERAAQRGYWPNAAESFAAAAEALQGAAKEVALYKRMLVLANNGEPQPTLAAADDLLAAFPKAYHYYAAQETRARVFASAGQMPKALQALDAVINAPGMNVRDRYAAKQFKIWLTRLVGASEPAQFAAAETALRELLQEIDRDPKRALAATPRLRTLTGLGQSLRGQGKTDEARQIYQQLLSAADQSTGGDILAGVYYGLGDASFEQAASLRERGAAADKVREQLDLAALHYLRVMLLYSAAAGQSELYGATRGAARVFSALFTMGGEKDCDIARRAYEYYRQAVQMQDRGEERRTLVREGKALKDRLRVARVPPRRARTHRSLQQVPVREPLHVPARHRADVLPSVLPCASRRPPSERAGGAGHLLRQPRFLPRPRLPPAGRAAARLVRDDERLLPARVGALVLLPRARDPDRTGGPGPAEPAPRPRGTPPRRRPRALPGGAVEHDGRARPCAAGRGLPRAPGAGARHPGRDRGQPPCVAERGPVDA
jgi:tetratricopeptide (TPR) repeat protein